MMVCAQTGAGKKAGFLLPVITAMLRYGPLPLPTSANRKRTFVTALILAPTRELAIQIYLEASRLCYRTGIRPVVVYEGEDIQYQQRELDLGADILVATPNQLIGHLESHRVKLEIVQFLVLDDADRMLEMGFEPKIRRIIQEERMPTKRQTFMFSSSFPFELRQLAGNFMREFSFIRVGPVVAAPQCVVQSIEFVEQCTKTDFVIDFLTRVYLKPVLIFVETRDRAKDLQAALHRQTFPAAVIYGDKSQAEIVDILQQFNSGHIPILVATYVVTRGRAISNVSQVINFDLPSNIDDYFRSIGLSSRAGNSGAVLSLINGTNRNIARVLSKHLSEKGQVLPPWLESLSNDQWVSKADDEMLVKLDWPEQMDSAMRGRLNPIDRRALNAMKEHTHPQDRHASHDDWEQGESSASRDRTYRQDGWGGNMDFKGEDYWISPTANNDFVARDRSEHWEQNISEAHAPMDSYSHNLSTRQSGAGYDSQYMDQQSMQSSTYHNSDNGDPHNIYNCPSSIHVSFNISDRRGMQPAPNPSLNPAAPEFQPVAPMDAFPNDIATVNYSSGPKVAVDLGDGTVWFTDPAALIPVMPPITESMQVPVPLTPVFYSSPTRSMDFSSPQPAHDYMLGSSSYFENQSVSSSSSSSNNYNNNTNSNLTLAENGVLASSSVRHNNTSKNSSPLDSNAAVFKPSRPIQQWN